MFVLTLDNEIVEINQEIVNWIGILSYLSNEESDNEQNPIKIYIKSEDLNEHINFLTLFLHFKFIEVEKPIKQETWLIDLYPDTILNFYQKFDSTYLCSLLKSASYLNIPEIIEILSVIFAFKIREMANINNGDG